MKFVIVAPSFDDTSGGTIALHLLCQRLREAGEVARLWRIDRPRLQPWRNPRRYLSWARYHLTSHRRPFDHGPFATELAHARDLRDAVVVYPEVLPGNWLGARHVVRWLLHKPGFHTGEVGFGADDLLFFYQAAFHDPSLGDYADNLLTLTWWNAAYRDWKSGPRSGSAYLVKKGRGRQLVHDLTNSTLVDTLDHTAKAAVFNRVERFYTYDPYTLYSRYAAICGAIPIIVPPPGLTRDEWVPREEDRYGLAYGEEEVDWAISTRSLLVNHMARERREEDTMIRMFIAKCRAMYARNSRSLQITTSRGCS